MKFNVQPEPINNDYPESWATVKEDLEGVSTITSDTDLVFVYQKCLVAATDLIRIKNKCGYNQALKMFIKACDERNAFGKEKYGTPLQPFNGRDSLQDAIEEALDLVVYLKTAILEEEMQ